MANSRPTCQQVCPLGAFRCIDAALGITQLIWVSNHVQHRSAILRL